MGLSQTATAAPVLSSKAKRLNRSRLGFLVNLASLRPIGAMGLEWTGTIMTGLQGIPRLAVMRCGTTKGADATKVRETEEEVLRVLVRRWGPLLTCVFDRGYASGPWLEVLERFGVRFIIRWIRKHLFYDQEGREKKLWEIGRGKRYLAHQLMRESSSGLKLACELWWTPIRHPTYPQQRYLVKARLKGHVCYLITNERVQSEEQAWEIFVAYQRRWQIETSFRDGKGELALESPGLWSLDNRLNRLGMVLLV